MARRKVVRGGTFMQTLNVIAGATDGDTSCATTVSQNAHVPFDGAVLVSATFVTRVAGVGATARVAAYLKAGTQTISATLPAVLATSAAETVHGEVVGVKTATPLTKDDLLKINTLESVADCTTGIDWTISLLWRL